MVQQEVTGWKKRLFLSSFFVLVLGFVGILSSGTSFAHAQTIHSLSGNNSTYTMTITRHGHTQTYTAHKGSDIVIPTATNNGGKMASIHYGMTFTTASGISPLIQYGGCGDVTAHADYYDVFGIDIMHYSIDEYFCNNGNGGAVTYFNSTPSPSWGTVLGVGMNSHNEYAYWVSQPWQANAVGNYDFSIGIPTPWGAVGSQCAGWLRIQMFGDGGASTQGSTC